MNNEKGHTFTVKDKSGKEIEYEILFTFNSEKNNKDYIIFTDNDTDESGSIITYAAIYTKKDDKIELSDIETEEEWNLVEDLLAQIEDKMEE